MNPFTFIYLFIYLCIYIYLFTGLYLMVISWIPGPNNTKEINELRGCRGGLRPPNGLLARLSFRENFIGVAGEINGDVMGYD